MLPCARENPGDMTRLERLRREGGGPVALNGKHLHTHWIPAFAGKTRLGSTPVNPGGPNKLSGPLAKPQHLCVLGVFARKYTGRATWEPDELPTLPNACRHGIRVHRFSSVAQKAPRPESSFPRSPRECIHELHFSALFNIKYHNIRIKCPPNDSCSVNVR